MRKWFRHANLFHKLIFILGLFVLPIAAINLYSNRLEQSTIRETVISSLESRVVFYLSTLETEIQRLQNITYSYVNDMDFMRLSMVYDAMTDFQRVESILNVREKLAAAKSISDYVENIYLYLPGIPRSVNAANSDYDLSYPELTALLNPEELNRMLVHYDGRLFVRSHIPTNNPATGLPDMLMAIEISTREISAVLHAIESSEAGGAVLIGDGWTIQPRSSAVQGEELAALTALRAEASTDKGTEIQRWSAGEYVIVWRSAPLIDATLMIYLPQESVLAPLRTAEMWLYVLSGLMLVLLLGTALTLYRSVHVPIRHMVDAFRHVEQGNHEIRLVTRNEDEFGYLYRQFNQMMDTLNNLIRQVYEQRILSQQSELKQLQAQINPHFFYNSFFAVRGLMDMGDIETASAMVDNLGRYFQYITRNSRDALPLKHEMSHARAYCEIQQLRFDYIDVEFEELPECAGELIVPRLIIQPVLENAYVYGLENKAEGGYLRLRFERGAGQLLIHIIDNGRNASEEVLHRLNEQLQANDLTSVETTGLINIHRRLRLFFAGAGGLQVRKNEPCGMHVIISLPWEGENHVPDTDRR